MVEQGRAAELEERHHLWEGAERDLRRWTRHYWVFRCWPDPDSAPRCVSDQPPSASRHSTPDHWLAIAAPVSGTRTGVPLVELRGAAGERGIAAQDLVLVLDLSDSTLAPSGFDVDGDGPGGRTDPELARELLARRGADPLVVQRVQQSDFDDSIVLAELAAAEHLVGRLDLAQHRVALVVFSDEAHTVAKLGSGREKLLRSLHRLRVDFVEHLRGTNFAEALDEARVALGPRSFRHRSAILLSDGEPTVPKPAEWAVERAEVSAAFLAGAGIRFYGLALGEEAADGLAVYESLAECTGGRVQVLERAGDAVVALREIDLADLASVRARNRTTGTAAMALRVFPTGEFDAFVSLAPGRNVVEVEAVLSDGRRSREEREIHYEPANASPEDVARLRALLETRTLELELWQEMKRTRRRQERVLDLRLDD